MKIAVITFSDMNTNYGSILQAVALKTFLEAMGHEVTFIKYREFNPIIINGFSNKIKYLLIKAYRLLNGKKQKERSNNFRSYIDNNLTHTRLFTSNKELCSLNQFDAYICGSDQIWNIPVLGGLRKPYFLDFAPTEKIKIAYAPSMGEYKLQDENKETFLNLLNNINFISIREESSLRTLSSMTDKYIQRVLDPVFLLDKFEWRSLIHNKPIIKGDYGLCYFVRRAPKSQYYINKLKGLYKMPIYNVSDNLITFSGVSDKFAACNPGDFLNILCNAKFCIGTSFHLCAFATIFKIPFYIISTDHNHERVQSILSLYGNDNAMILNKDEINVYNSFKKFDFTHLDKAIASSKQFLINALASANSTNEHKS